MKYTMENFKNGEFAIFCEKEEYADHLITLLDKGDRTRWEHYKNYTCCYYPCNNLTYRHLNKCIEDGLHIVEYNEFIKKIELNEKSNKEKVLEILDVKVGEKFNISDSSYNPFYFDEDYEMRDCDGDRCTIKVIDILWRNSKIEKLPEDTNVEVKKYIELLSTTTPLTKNIREGILVSLKEILELKEQKSA